MYACALDRFAVQSVGVCDVRELRALCGLYLLASVQAEAKRAEKTVLALELLVDWEEKQHNLEMQAKEEKVVRAFLPSPARIAFPPHPLSANSFSCVPLSCTAIPDACRSHAHVCHVVQDRKGFNVAGLDSNHSHFILVEDESYRKGAGFGCDLSTMRSTRVMVMAVSVACKRHRRCAALMMLDHARFNARASPAAI